MVQTVGTMGASENFKMGPTHRSKQDAACSGRARAAFPMKSAKAWINLNVGSKNAAPDAALQTVREVSEPALFDTAAADEHQSPQVTVEITKAQSDAVMLPAGWEKMTDPMSGRPYYANHRLKTTQWDFPMPADNHGSFQETTVQSVVVGELHSPVQIRWPPFLIRSCLLHESVRERLLVVCCRPSIILC